MKLKLISQAAGVLLLMLTATTAHAERDDFPSCYSLLGSKSAVDVRGPERELVVLVDQTAPLNKKLYSSAMHKVYDFVRPGDALKVIGFSANAEGEYASLELAGRLDAELSDKVRHKTSKSKLTKFDKCLVKQRKFADRRIYTVLQEIFSKSTNSHPKSELIGTYAEIGDNVIRSSAAGGRTVFIISDMIENSSILSFYKRGTVPVVTVDDAIAKVVKDEAFSDWGGARIFVLGAGYLGDGKYRSAKVLKSIKGFWAEYFELSNASLVGWGAPDLMVSID